MGESLTRRIAALLGDDGEAAAQELRVDGQLPDEILAVLPGHVRVCAADAPASVPVPTDAAGDPSGARPPAALMLLDDEPGDAALERRLGTACRRFPGRVLVWQRDRLSHEPVPATRFFAYGFRQRLLDRDEQHRHALYEYRLSDYKQPPDWLNARFWANPERFALDEQS